MLKHNGWAHACEGNQSSHRLCLIETFHILEAEKSILLNKWSELLTKKSPKSLRAKWPMEPALISWPVSVVLAPCRRWYSFTYPWRMESWFGLGRKEDRTNIQISAKQGLKLGTLWSEGRDLTNCANHARTMHENKFYAANYKPRTDYCLP